MTLSSDGGIGFVASAVLGRGHADGKDDTRINTASKQARSPTTSGGDTTLQGAARLGSDLAIKHVAPIFKMEECKALHQYEC